MTFYWYTRICNNKVPFSKSHVFQEKKSIILALLPACVLPILNWSPIYLHLTFRFFTTSEISIFSSNLRHRLVNFSVCLCFATDGNHDCNQALFTHWFHWNEKTLNETFEWVCLNYNNLLVVGVNILAKRFALFCKDSPQVDRKDVIKIDQEIRIIMGNQYAKKFSFASFVRGF